MKVGCLGGATVHPHVRGEQVIGEQDNMTIDGSSPRTRGADPDRGAGLSPERFIPTYAGSSHPSTLEQGLEAVHPHVRGEQARGVRGRGCAAVHPHVRGEQGENTQRTNYNGGSSPRTRGAVDPWSKHGVSSRFIPTYAGSRGAQALRAAGAPVHPHVRGEQAPSYLSAAQSTGSSPRTRGAAPEWPLLRHPRRFIPACAGSSYGSVLRCLTGAVHPRVRGEQCVAPNSMLGHRGSSPRARGAGVHHEPPRAVRRFIPACAGSSHASPDVVK